MKLSSIIKSTATAAFLLGFASPAIAGLTAGKSYNFTCTYELADQSFASELLGGSFTFTVDKANLYNATVSNFVVEGQLTWSDNGDGSYDVEQRIDWDKQLAFSNAAGEYPFGATDIYLTITVDDEGVMTIPDFTVVKYNMAAGTASIVAKYSNCKATFNDGNGNGNGNGNGEDDDSSDVTPVGDHKFNWYKTTYDDPENPVTKLTEMVFTINDNMQYTTIAGYEVDKDFLDWGYDQGVFKNNVWSIDLNNFSNIITMNQETGEGIRVSGPNFNLNDLETGPDTNNSVLTLSYDKENSVWNLSDFSIWEKKTETVTGDTDEEGNVSTETKTVWKVLALWSSKGVETGMNSVVVPENIIEGVYNLQGVKVAASAEELTRLPKGIYIINGKKVVAGVK